MWVLALGLGCGDGEPVDQGAIDDDGDGAVLGDDCDDTNEAVHPDADERCNAIDDDCDGLVDEDAVDAVVVYADADADGYGGEAGGTACVPGANQAAASGDCDDADPGAHPGATEICNGGVDDDCDGTSDDEDDKVAGASDWYADEDQDGYGSGTPTSSCVAPKGLIADASDCDDLDATVHPGAEDVCNGIDDDCDPYTSETGTVSHSGVLYWAIQDAIDAASDGDLVEICSGTFYENLEIDKSIELSGVSSDVSIVDGSGLERSVVSVVRPGALLTIRNLTLQYGASQTETGGIAALDAAGLVVEDSVVAHNSGSRGGGIEGPQHGPTSILGSVVTDNTSSASGGGLVLYNDGTNVTEVRDSEITNNTCRYFGGGIGFFDSTTSRMAVPSASMVDTLVDGNVAFDAPLGSYGSGGGIAAFATNLTVAGVTVSNNEGEFGGGVYMLVAEVVADDTTVVSGNTGDTGGGLYVDTSVWQYGSIEANTATTAGGGVYLWQDADVRGSQILSNVSAAGGGGIYASGYSSAAETAAADCTIEGNVAATEGGGALVVNVGFRTSSSDWGSGATDNDPDDLVFYATTTTTEPLTFSDLETVDDFVCDMGDAACE